MWGGQRYAGADRDAKRLQTFDFHRIIGQQAHLQERPVLEDELPPQTHVAFVPHHEIGIDGVIAHILVVIGPQLVEDADPAALLAGASI